MSKEKNNEFQLSVESNFTLFDLKLRASQIKNGYSIQNSLNSLADFIQSNKLRLTNP